MGGRVKSSLTLTRQGRRGRGGGGGLAMLKRGAQKDLMDF